MMAKSSMNSSLDSCIVPDSLTVLVQIFLPVENNHFEINAGITLDVEGQLFGIRPFAVTPAVLAITYRILPVYST